MSPRFRPAFSRRRKRWVRLGVCAVIVAVAVLSYGFAETYRLQVKEYTFTSPDLPAAFDGTRIVLLTDIHRGRFFSQRRVAELVDRVDTLEPDLVVMGGDYVYADTDYEASCFEELARLRAPLGRVAVLGNHDYGEHDDDSGPGDAIRAITESGITLLRNDAVWVEKDGQRIRVGGVGDYDQGRPDYGPTLAGTTKSDFVLLVSHNPDYAEELPPDAVDLVLSGHTHGGQVTFFGRWAFHIPSDYGQKYRTGMVTNDATTVIVSKGVGTSTILPIRILCRPEIVVITLRSGPPAIVRP